MTTTLKPTVYGVGINDVPKSWGKPYYRVWYEMFRRSYDPKWHARKPTYIGCTVDSRWHHLSDFKRWYEEQGDVKGKQLDKDIISPGNKVYGPDKCLLITRELNLFFTKRDSYRGELPIGVFQRGERFVAAIGLGKHGKRWHIGSYDTPEEAHQVWLKEKRKQLYERYILPETNERLKNALMNVYNNMEEYFK